MARTRSHLLCLLVLALAAVCARGEHSPQTLQIEPVRANVLLPANEVNCLYFDHQGFLWVGTKSGLFRYDGYRVKQFRNIPSRPHVLTANTVKAVAEDRQRILWVGTHQGLTRIDPQSGRHTDIHLTDYSNCDVVNCILITRSGHMWVGTEGGLYGRGSGDADSLVFYCDKRGNAKVPHCSINALMEDSEGYVWIGTWDKGLYRFNPRNGQFYEMPRFNDLNSAQTLAEDAHGRLWVGTWGKGLYCIENPHATHQGLHFRHYGAQADGSPIVSDVIWSICADSASHLLWVGTKSGLSVVRPDTVGTAPLPVLQLPAPDFFARGVNAIVADRRGHMWINSYERGIASVSTRPSHFNTRQLTPQQRATDHISCVAYDQEGRLLIGTSHSGIIMPTTGAEAIAVPSRVNAILPLGTDSLLVGTLRDGLLLLHQGRVVRQYRQESAPWLHDNCIYTLLSTPSGTIIAGTWRGVSIIGPDGRGAHLDGPALGALATAKVCTAIQDAPNSLWLGSTESGIFHLTGSVSRPSSLRVQQYTTLAGTDFRTLNIYRLLADRYGRIWGCSQEAGLMLYDAEHDGFVHVSERYGIPEDDIYSVEEAADGYLWLSSRHHLISLAVDGEGNVADLRFFDRQDVVSDDHFGPAFSAAAATGELCFAGQFAYAAFSHTDIPAPQPHRRAIITDIKLNNQSLYPLPTEQLVLQPSQRDLTIEFSSLDFDNPDALHYAYMLDGLDREWHYTDAGASQVSYSQLPAGTYTFRLRSTIEGGSWSPDEQVLVIRRLAPVWQRWYAWLFYIMAAVGLLLLMVRYYSARKLHQQELQLARVERQNAVNKLEEYKQRTYEKVREDLFADICSISTPPTEEEFVRQCLTCVQRHIANPDFGLQQFADAMCMSSSTLYKKLRAATGLSTSAFIRTVRMKSARELLLQNPQARIADVAYAVGYSDPKYFSSCFKKDFGMLPGALRSQKR
ncbi:MAG: helix-turn-helix domain-containing protein [Bacteroidaceae bacterium]|nr:helix-turn-helix domain-containing protein [Bacteroidaceae bacterium]